MISNVLKLGSRLTVLPIVHGSGDYALEVRRFLLKHDFDCLAVPLPRSFQQHVETAIGSLPRPTMVLQPATQSYSTEWQPDDNLDDSFDEDSPPWSYVPVDPCQGVIAALRVAMEEHIPRVFVDQETEVFQAYSQPLPDPYALKRLPIERFAAGTLPSLTRVPPGQPQDRVNTMAARLRELETRYGRVLLVCSLSQWPWIRAAYLDRAEPVADEDVPPTRVHVPDANTLVFMLGELPFITGLYERARSHLDDDGNLSIDGVKEMLLVARDRYRRELKRRARPISPQMLSTYLKYVRNLSLVERRMTPDLYTLVVAAKQIAGDRFALTLAETARDYPYEPALPFDSITLGVDRGRLADGTTVNLVNRLAGPPCSWRTLDLQSRPESQEKTRWQMRWNPYGQCSWPPEDDQIEQFRTCVSERAKALLGIDLARSEKFTTSIKDGIDVRETVRNWHTGDIYVKVLPPTRGSLDCVVMLFEHAADPRDYPWRTTWYAEHDEESTMAFYATDYRAEMAGPGIGLATYGGAMFLYPPRPISDIWTDRGLDFANTLEERVISAACLHSESRHIALLSGSPPGAAWRRLAKRFGKRLVHLPLSQFSASHVAQLRMVHVLSGKQVRSYAAHFIRKA